MARDKSLPVGIQRPSLGNLGLSRREKRGDWGTHTAPVEQRRAPPVVHAVCYYRSDTRSRVVARAMEAGIQSCGDHVIALNTEKYGSRPQGHVAVFYGFKGHGKEIFRDYIAAGRRVVFIDLGYWARRGGIGRIERYNGHHRIAVNNRHASNMVLQYDCPPDRLDALRTLPSLEADACLDVRPWRRGDAVLVAGSQLKSSESYGMAYMEWEERAVKILREHTQREIIYRPKPKDENARPIEGTTYSPRTEKLSSLWPRLHAVVTHHSNVGVTAIAEGVPVFCFDGIHLPMASSNLAAIEQPYYPKDSLRRQWLQNVAYWQWTVDEMREGKVWRQLKKWGVL